MNVNTESVHLEEEQPSSARAREDETDLETGHTQEEETSTSQTQRLRLVDRILVGAAFASSVLQMVLERESERLPATHWAAMLCVSNSTLISIRIDAHNSFYCLWVIDISIVISRHVRTLRL
jgi:hypothetical protein